MADQAQGHYTQTGAQAYWSWWTDPNTAQEQRRDQQPDGHENGHPQHTVPLLPPQGHSLPPTAYQSPADSVRLPVPTYQPQVRQPPPQLPSVPYQSQQGVHNLEPPQYSPYGPQYTNQDGLVGQRKSQQAPFIHPEWRPNMPISTHLHQYPGYEAPTGTQTFSGAEITYTASGPVAANTQLTRNSDGLVSQGPIVSNNQQDRIPPSHPSETPPGFDITQNEERNMQAKMRARITQEKVEKEQKSVAREEPQQTSEQNYIQPYPASSHQPQPLANGYVHRLPAPSITQSPAYQSSGDRPTRPYSRGSREHGRPPLPDYRLAQQTPISHDRHAGDPGRLESSHQHVQIQSREFTSGQPSRHEDSYAGSSSTHGVHQSNGHPQTPPTLSREVRWRSRPSAVQVLMGGAAMRQQSQRNGDGAMENTGSPKNIEGMGLDWIPQGQPTQPPRVQSGSGAPDVPPPRVQDTDKQATAVQRESCHENQVSSTVPPAEETEGSKLPSLSLPPIKTLVPELDLIYTSAPPGRPVFVSANEANDVEETNVDNKSSPSLPQAASASETNQGAEKNRQDLQRIVRDAHKIISSTNRNIIPQSHGTEEPVTISPQTQDMETTQDGPSRTARDLAIRAGAILNNSDDSYAQESSESEVTPGSSQQGRLGKRGRGSGSCIGSEGPRDAPRNGWSSVYSR